MGVLTSRLIVSLTNKVSGPAGQVVNSMNRMNAAGRGAAAGMAMANRQIATQGRTMAKHTRRLTGGSGMVGMGAAAGAYAFLKNELTYQEAMNRTRAILNITDEQAFKPHRDLVVDLAKKYPATSAEIAKGASELAMAGMTMTEVNAVLEATVQGAMASGESIKTVGMGVTDVVMGLGKALTKENFLEINNMLAAAATSYAQDYTQFLAGFAKTAPIARMVGLEVNQLAGYLGILADAGFKAEKGGTAFRTSMINAAAPTAKAMGWLKQYGIKLEDFKKQVDEFQLGGSAGAESLADLVADGLGIDSEGLDLKAILTPLLSDPTAFKDVGKLKKRLTGAITDALSLKDPVSTQLIAESVNSFIQAGFQELDLDGLLKKMAETGFDQNIEAMKEMFGKRFVAQMGAIINSIRDGTFGKKMEMFLPRIEGAVERFAEILLSGLPGALKRLGGAFDGLLRAMASSGAIDTVVGIFEKLRDVINDMSSTAPGTLKAITLTLFSLGALAPLGFILGGLASGATAVYSALMLTATAARMAGTALLMAGSTLTIGAWTALAAAIAGARRHMAAFSLLAMAMGTGGAAKTAMATMAAGAMALLNPMKLVGAAIRGVGVALRFAFISTGVGAVIAAIAAAGTFIYNNWQGVKELFAGIGEGFMAGLGPAGPVVEGLVSGIGTLIGYVGDMLGPLEASKEQWRSWGVAIGQVLATPVRLIGELIAFLGNNKLTRLLGLTSEQSGAVAKKAVEGLSQPAGELKPLSPLTGADSAPPPSAPAPAPSGGGLGSQIDPAQLQAELSRLDASAQAIAGSVQSAMSQVQSIVAGVDLTGQGMRIMETLAAGMRAKAAAVVAEIQAITQQIRDHLPSSPAKTGPLSDLHRLKFGETIARSIDGGPMVSAMRRAVTQTRGELAPISVQPMRRGAPGHHASAAAFGMGGRGGGDITVNVNIPAGVTDPARIGNEVGRQVRAAVRDSFSDGGI